MKKGQFEKENKKIIAACYLSGLIGLLYRYYQYTTIMQLFEENFTLTYILMIIHFILGSVYPFLANLFRSNGKHLIDLILDFFYFKETNKFLTSAQYFERFRLGDILLKLESKVFMYQLIFYESRQNYTFIITWVLTSLLVNIIKYIDYKQSSYVFNIYHQNFLISFARNNLIFGLYLLCHKYSYFYIYYLIIFLIIYAQNYSNWFQNNIIKLGYNWDHLDLQGLFKQFALYFQLLGFQVSHNKHFQAVNTQYNFKQELYYQKCLESISIIQIIILYVFAVVINKDDHIMKQIFTALLLFLLFHIFSCLKFLYKYIRYGPNYRVININGYSIRNLSSEEINKQYFRFKSKQQYIFVDISNFDQELLYQLIIQLLNSKRFFLITQKFDYQLNQYSRILFDYDKKFLELNINSKWVALAALKALDKFINVLQSIHINCIFDVEDLIECYIVQNLEIVPFLKIQMQNIRFQNIIQSIQNEIMKFIIYQKYFQQYLVVNPKFVYYDLCDM